MVFVGFVDAIVLLDFVVFVDSIILLGLWVLIMVNGKWVFDICWVNGKAFFFFFLFLLFVFLRKSLFFNFFFFFSESEKGKRETFREKDEREKRCNRYYKPFEDKD